MQLLNKILSLSNADLDAIDMSGHKCNEWFELPSGQEHYRLLAWIAQTLDNALILDIGTFRGDSSLALSFGNNTVISWDVSNLREHESDKVQYNVGDILEHPELLASADFILLDTYHTGEFEKSFLAKLDEVGFKGLLLLDDIRLNDAMREVWSGIAKDKHDITNIGHHSGTGVVLWK